MIATWFSDLPGVVQFAIEAWAVLVLVGIVGYIIIAATTVIAALVDSRRTKRYHRELNRRRFE